MIKNIINIIAILLFGVYAFAQTLTISPNSPITGNGTTDDWDVPVHSYVHNNSGGSLNLVWKRTIISSPSQWKTGICDNIACYTTTVDSSTFTVAAGDSGQLIAHFYPYYTPGNCVLQLTVYEQGNSSNSVSANYSADVILAGIDDRYSKEKIAFYPNPTQDYLQIQYPDYYEGNFEIFNVLGVKVRSAKADGTSINFNLASLPKGIYFLRFKNETGIVLTKNFIKE